MFLQIPSRCTWSLKSSYIQPRFSGSTFETERFSVDSIIGCLFLQIIHILDLLCTYLSSYDHQPYFVYSVLLKYSICTDKHPFNLYCTLYIVHCTLYTVHCTLRAVHTICTVCSRLMHAGVLFTYSTYMWGVFFDKENSYNFPARFRFIQNKVFSIIFMCKMTKYQNLIKNFRILY